MKRKTIVIICAITLCLILTGCDSSQYKKATALYEEGRYEDAIAIFEALGDYEDSAAKLEQAKTDWMLQKYSDVIDLMADDIWFFNGGSDTVVNSIAFTDKGRAEITQIVIDGNGVSADKAEFFDYTVEDTNISVALSSGRPLDIPYSVSNGSLHLGSDGTYRSIAEVEEDLQGYWQSRETHYFFTVSESEYIVLIKNGMLTEESASEDISGQYEYWYYEPEEESYTITRSGFHTSGNEYSFNIFNGRAVLLRYEHICSPTGGFKGFSGFSF